MRAFLGATGLAIYAVAYPLSQLAAIGIHLYAVYIGWYIYGLFGAVVTFLFPFLAEVFYLYKMYINVGLVNWLSVSCAVFLALCALNLIALVLMGWADARRSG